MFSPTNFLMFSMLILSIFIVLSTNSWFSAWIGMEINTLAFITIISSSNQESSESTMIYFLPQTLASSIFIMFSILPSQTAKLMHHQNLTSIIILTALSMKLGMAPLHQWFPKITPNLSWHHNLILMTIQKIPPMFLISLLIYPLIFFLFIILSSALFGPLGGLSQTKIKSILAFSSISHMAWMGSSIIINQTFWLIYLFIYSTILMTIIMLLTTMKISTLNQMSSYYKSINKKLLFIVLLLSLGGLPPLTGFFPKWFIITNLQSNLLLLILISSSLLNLFFYLRISYSIMFLKSPSNLSSSLPFSYSKPSSPMILTLFLLPSIIPIPILLST